MAQPTPKVLIVGAGGHAKVVIENLRAAGGYDLVGLIDADTTPREVLGLAVLGDDSLLPRLRAEGVTRAFIGVGDNARRARLGEQVRGLGFTLVNAIHPSAILSPSATLGQGVAVMAGAAINAEAWIGDLAVVNTNASVDHDCRLGAACHVGPGAALAGNVTVGERAFMGVGSSAIQGVSIGDGAIVGAGGCVISDIPAGATAVGVPARVKRL